MGEPHSSYPLSVRWTGGKGGVASAPDGLPALEVGSPVQFGGPGRQWTPEHFFVGAATVCWMTTFLAVAELSKLEVGEVSATGEGFVEKGEDRRYAFSRIVLRPRVSILREEDRERALRLIQKAEDACLVARSMKAPVELEAEVFVEAHVEV